MVSHNERQRLMRDYRGEPAYAVGVLLKCAACLLILVGIAVIGAQVGLPSQPPMEAAAGGAPAPDQRRVLVVETDAAAAGAPTRPDEWRPASHAQGTH
jgi:hypothetical protein